jgi:hypothetical protein
VEKFTQESLEGLLAVEAGEILRDCGYIYGGQTVGSVVILRYHNDKTSVGLVLDGYGDSLADKVVSAKICDKPHA